MHFKTVSAKGRQFCLDLNLLSRLYSICGQKDELLGNDISSEYTIYVHTQHQLLHLNIIGKCGNFDLLGSKYLPTDIKYAT